MSDFGQSDDENDQQQNVSAENIEHDDFDYAAIFDKLSKDAPQMSEILKAAKKFGDAHRHLINKFVLESCMKTKKMNLIFAKYVTMVQFKKHPEAVMKIKTTPEESRELSKVLVKTMNKEKGESLKDFSPWRFVISTDEKSPTEYVTMTGCTQNSTVISDASDMKKEERALLLTILEEMVKGDGTAGLQWVHEQTKEGHCKMPEGRYDTFLTKMGRLKYLHVDHDNACLEITPRILVELEPWIRAKLVGEFKTCDLCRKIIARPIYTAECKNCKALSHFNCFKNATVISKKDEVECQQCKTMIDLNEVVQQVESKKSEDAPTSSRNTNRRSRRSRTTDTDDVADTSSRRRVKSESDEDV